MTIYSISIQDLAKKFEFRQISQFSNKIEIFFFFFSKLFEIRKSEANGDPKSATENLRSLKEKLLT